MTSQNLFNDWIDKISRNDTVDSDIIAFNFGIFESDNSFTVYLTGSTEFDEDDYDWACNDDFVPSEKYLTLPDSEFSNLDWQSALSKIEELVSNFINSMGFNKSLLVNAKAITTGFDEGDLIRVK